jgi:hypothetical protein
MAGSEALLIITHLNKTWPLVIKGIMTSKDATLGTWPISDEKLDRYGDVVVGVYENAVVSAYDIDGHYRDDNNKVAFEGRESTNWSRLIGQPTPAKPWGTRGDAWPVRFIDTAVVAGGDVAVERTPTGRRAVIDDVVLNVDDDHHITIVIPAGRSLTVQTIE